jgi:cysteine synthase
VVTRFVDNVTELIKGTPLMRLGRFGAGLPVNLIGKIEAFNPGWSVKDRIGLKMIEDAEASGALKPGGIIVEPTSGNTGIGLATVAAVKGYRCLLTMPSSMSVERRKVMLALGVELILTDGFEGMPGAIREAYELAAELKDSYMPEQFKNPSNPAAHYTATGPEIWETTEGKVDVLVSGVGTGGTITGTGRYLKEQNPKIQIVAVEPEESPVLSGGVMGPHMIQGIGAGFIPDTCDTSLIDEIVQVNSFEAIETAQEFALKEGFIAGISSGAALAAARKLAANDAYAGKNIVVIMPDIGERYVSTLLFYHD